MTANTYLNYPALKDPAPGQASITQEQYNDIVTQHLTELWTNYGELAEICAFVSLRSRHCCFYRASSYICGSAFRHVCMIFKKFINMPGFDGGFSVPGLKEQLLELYNRTQPNAAVFNGCGERRSPEGNIYCTLWVFSSICLYRFALLFVGTVAVPTIQA
eukprot:COSAG02_NODE_2452_length_8826_cov_16.362668_4_plen_160_part_00